MMETLGEALPKEIDRVMNKIMPRYIEIGVSGQFALAMMRQDISRATRAMAEGDIAGMVAAYQSLKEYED